MKQEGYPETHKVLLKAEDVLDKDVFENTWLPFGDNKDRDINHLIVQGRIRNT